MSDHDQWFERVFQATYADAHLALRRLVARYPLLKNDFDDILESTYVEVSRNREKLQRHENPSAWVVLTLKNKARARFRQKQRELGRLDRWATQEGRFSLTVDTITPEQIFLEKEAREAFREDVVRLIGEEGYAILMRHYDQEVPLKELAAQYGMSAGALKMKLHRWKKKIRRGFAEGRRPHEQ